MSAAFNFLLKLWWLEIKYESSPISTWLSFLINLSLTLSGVPNLLKSGSMIEYFGFVIDSVDCKQKCAQIAILLALVESNAGTP